MKYAELNDDLVMPNDFTEIEVTEEIAVHEIQVTAPVNVEDSVKDMLHDMAGRLTDDELAYAVVWMKDELEMRQNEDMLEQEVYARESQE